MFNGNGIETDNNLVIEDADFEVFNAFIHCLYGEQIDIDQDNVEALLRLSNKYAVNDLVSSCSVFMVQQLSIKNVFNYLNVANTYNLAALQHCCAKLISEKTGDILELPEFLNYNKNELTIIVRLEKISCTEVKIFDNCMKWAKQRCCEKKLDESGENIRKELGNCFSLIRFKEMGNDEFVERCKVYNNGLLSNNEICELMVYFLGKGIITKKRYEETTVKEVTFRFNPIGRKQIKDSAECSILFSTSKPLVLTKISISNILLQTTDNFAAWPSLFTLQITKDDMIVYTLKRDFDVEYKGVLFPIQNVLISVGEHRLGITLKAKEIIGSKFVEEFDIKEQINAE